MAFKSTPKCGRAPKPRPYPQNISIGAKGGVLWPLKVYQNAFPTGASPSDSAVDCRAGNGSLTVTHDPLCMTHADPCVDAINITQIALYSV